MQPQEKRCAGNAREPIASLLHDHIRTGKAPKHVERLRGRGGQSLAILEVNFIVERTDQPQIMASFCQAAVPAATPAGGVCSIRVVRKRTALCLEKIAKGIETRVIAKAAREIGIASEEGACSIARLLQNRNQRWFIRRQANHVTAQRERISGSHDRRK